jgi:hypothetical protein
MARSPSSACLYDECTADTDCKSPFMCTCGQGGGFTNYCTAAGNCRVDSDCASGYCSPTVDGCGTFTGYFCHTAADECYSDDDCVNAGFRRRRDVMRRPANTHLRR